jgi:hypothetical protein
MKENSNSENKVPQSSTEVTQRSTEGKIKNSLCNSVPSLCLSV